MTISSFGIAATTFTGQNFGAGNYDRVRKGAKICLIMAMGTTIIISSSLYFGGSYVLRLTWIFTAVPVWRSIKTVVVSYPLAWITTTVFFILYYFYYVKKHKIA